MSSEARKELEKLQTKVGGKVIHVILVTKHLATLSPLVTWKIESSVNECVHLAEGSRLNVESANHVFLAVFHNRRTEVDELKNKLFLLLFF